MLCPLCKRVLTGSISKGNRAYYAYYHCYNGCKFRIRASNVDKQFNDFLHELKPTQVIIDLFRIILKTTLDLNWKESAIKQNQITKNIEHLFDRSIKAKELLLRGEIEDEDFRVIKTDCELKVNSIGKDLQQVAQQIITVQKELDNEAAKISHIDKVYSAAPFEIKKKIIKLLFKEKVVPNDDTFRKSELEHVSIVFNKKKIFQGVAPLKNFDCQKDLNYDEKNKYYCNELLKQLAVNQSKLSSMFWGKFPEITDFLEKLAIILHLQPFN